MKPRSERNRRRDQTARLPGRWRKLRYRRSRRYRVSTLEMLTEHE